MHSLASNISEGTNTVDLRTGLLGASITLFSGTTNKGLGPELNLVLTYDPMNTSRNVGYGYGWRYDFANVVSGYEQIPVITLSTGESFQFNAFSPGEIDLIDAKLKNVKVMVDDNENYTIYYKDGSIDYLEYQSSKASLLTKSVTPDGKFVTYEYEASPGISGMYLLSKVTDMFGNVVLEIANNSYDTIVTRWPGSSMEQVVTIERVNDFVKFASIPNSDKIGTYFEYDTSVDPYVRSLLVKITNPLGYVIDVKYGTGESGHILPQNGPYYSYPRVVQSIESEPNGYESVVTKYSYSSSAHFLGSSNSTWNDERDNSYIQGIDFSYSVTAESEETGKRVTNTYNRFHLKTTEEVVNFVVDEFASQTVITEYYAEAISDFDAQPAYFTLPKKVTNRFKVNGNTRDEVTEYTYDDYGNNLVTIEPSGIKTETTYYSAEGELDSEGNVLCPPNFELGMDNFVKTVIRNPASSKFADEPISETHYIYKIVPFYTKNDSGADDLFDAIQLVEERELVDNVQISKQNYEHYTQAEVNDPVITGLRKNAILNYNTKLFLSNLVYEIYDETYAITSTNTPYFDGSTVFDATKSTVQKQEVNFHLGRPVSKEKKVKYGDQDVLFKTIMEYDLTNYSMTETVIDANNNNKVTNRKINFLYNHGTPDQHGIEMLETDFKNNVSRKVADYRGLEKQNYIQYFNQDVEHLLGDKVYDQGGKLIDEFNYDYLSNSSTKASQQISQKVTYIYDWKDQVKTTQKNDVSSDQIYTIYDYYENSYIQKSDRFPSYVKTYLNVDGLEIKQEKYSMNDTLIATVDKVYDGLNRLREVIFPAVIFADDADAKIRKLLINYDQLGRPNYSQYGLVGADGITIDPETALELSLEYWPDSPEQLPCKLIADGIEIMNVTYDQQFRKIQETKGDLKTQYVFNSPDTPVDQVVNNAGTSIFYAYDPMNFLKNKSISVGDKTNPSYYAEIKGYTDTYQPTGVITKYSGNVVVDKNYHREPASDVMKQIDFVNYLDNSIDSFSKLSYEYSDTFNTAISKNDIFDSAKSYTYNANGTINTVSYNGISIAYTYYTEYPELINTITTNTNDGRVLTTLYTYDEFGNTASIAYTATNEDNTKIEYEYDYVLSKIITKHLYRADALVVTEKYKYDYMGRLYSVVYSGSQDYFPTDQYNNILVSEIFSHDKLNNLTKVVSNFADGTNNEAVYIYENQHFAQVSALTNTHSSYPQRIDFTYDNLGNLTYDGDNNIEYDELSRVKSINGQAVYYDESGKIISIESKTFVYDKDSLMNELDANKQRIGYENTASYAESDGVNYTLYKRDVKNSNIENT